MIGSQKGSIDRADLKAAKALLDNLQ